MPLLSCHDDLCMEMDCCILKGMQVGVGHCIGSVNSLYWLVIFTNKGIFVAVHLSIFKLGVKL